MDDKNIKTAMNIVAELLAGTEISAKIPATQSMYNEFYTNSDVYELVTKMLQRMNISIYEYKESIFITAGEENKTFGYTNDDLKKRLNLRVNRELFLVYLIIYETILFFYTDSSTYQVKDFLRMEELLSEMDSVSIRIAGEHEYFEQGSDEMENFRSVALLWDSLPVVTNEDKERNKASRGSKVGYIKLTMNFLSEEKLVTVMDDRFYPTDRMRCITENYFEEYKGRIYQILGEKNA